MASRMIWASRAASYMRISLMRRGFATVPLLNYVLFHKFVEFSQLSKHPFPHKFRKQFLDSYNRFRKNPSKYFKDLVIKDLKYAETHEWVKVDGKSAIVGITDHAQDHLGDVVYVELPEVGSAVTQGGTFGAVESVKATSDILSPVSGKVVDVNTELNNSPGLINGSPYENGWIMKVELSESSEVKKLMGSEEYTKFCEEEDAHH